MIMNLSVDTDSTFTVITERKRNEPVVFACGKWEDLKKYLDKNLKIQDTFRVSKQSPFYKQLIQYCKERKINVTIEETACMVEI